MWCPCCGTELDQQQVPCGEYLATEVWCWKCGWSRYYDYPEQMEFLTQPTWYLERMLLEALSE